MDNNVDFTLMAERIKDIHKVVNETKTDVRDLKTRMTLIEQGYGLMSNRIDRLEGYIERIEHAIGIQETKQ